MSRSEEYELLYERLRNISFYEDNWDGNGSIAPSSMVVKRAMTFLQSLLDVKQTKGYLVDFPQIVPTVNGTISFEWSWPEDKVFICAEVEEHQVSLQLFNNYPQLEDAAVAMGNILENIP